MNKKTCCVTGHRDIPIEQVERIKRKLRREIESAVADGFTHFLSGFAEGADQYFAEIVAEFCERDERLSLEAAIPYRGRLERLGQYAETRRLLMACRKISVISEEYAKDVYQKRNQYMVEQSERMIAVYDGRETGGTAGTIRFARKKGIELREIHITD